VIESEVENTICQSGTRRYVLEAEAVDCVFFVGSRDLREPGKDRLSARINLSEKLRVCRDVGNHEFSMFHPVGAARGSRADVNAFSSWHRTDNNWLNCSSNCRLRSHVVITLDIIIGLLLSVLFSLSVHR